MKRRKHKQEVTVVETPIVVETTEAPNTVEITETPAAPEAPATTNEKSNEPAEAKVKKARYAPVSILQDNARIASVMANPKRPGKKSYDRYARFYRVGQTVAEYVQSYKDANLSGMLARNDLRWDFEHGFITLEAPETK
jgi:hypothetical protein